jgi:integrase
MWEASIETYVNPVIGTLPVAAIDLPLVMKVLEPIWTTTTETASRLRGRIEAVLGWATTRGYRQGDNPARWRGHLEKLLPKPGKVKRVERFPALPYAGVSAFMAELRRQDSIGAHPLEFLILTAARTGEVTGARWDEISLAERLWTVPASRMKAGREHRVPLSDAAVAIVEQMAATRLNDYVFPGSAGPLNHKALLRVLTRMGRSDITVHGMRSTFRDWAAERTNYPAEVAEMALAHTVGSAVEQAYRRSDLFERRRRLMDDWARFCHQLPAAGNVVTIRA